MLKKGDMQDISLSLFSSSADPIDRCVEGVQTVQADKVGKLRLDLFPARL